MASNSSSAAPRKRKTPSAADFFDDFDLSECNIFNLDPAPTPIVSPTATSQPMPAKSPEFMPSARLRRRFNLDHDLSQDQDDKPGTLAAKREKWEMRMEEERINADLGEPISSPVAAKHQPASSVPTSAATPPMAQKIPPAPSFEDDMDCDEPASRQVPATTDDPLPDFEAFEDSGASATGPSSATVPPTSSKIPPAPTVEDDFEDDFEDSGIENPDSDANMAYDIPPSAAPTPARETFRDSGYSSVSGTPMTNSRAGTEKPMTADKFLDDLANNIESPMPSPIQAQRTVPRQAETAQAVDPFDIADPADDFQAPTPAPAPTPPKTRIPMMIEIQRLKVLADKLSAAKKTNDEEGKPATEDGDKSTSSAPKASAATASDNLPRAQKTTDEEDKRDTEDGYQTTSNAPKPAATASDNLPRAQKTTEHEKMRATGAGDKKSTAGAPKATASDNFPRAQKVGDEKDKRATEGTPKATPASSDNLPGAHKRAADDSGHHQEGGAKKAKTTSSSAPKADPAPSAAAPTPATPQSPSREARDETLRQEREARQRKFRVSPAKKPADKKKAPQQPEPQPRDELPMPGSFPEDEEMSDSPEPEASEAEDCQMSDLEQEDVEMTDLIDMIAAQLDEDGDVQMKGTSDFKLPAVDSDGDVQMDLRYIPAVVTGKRKREDECERDSKRLKTCAPRKRKSYKYERSIARIRASTCSTWKAWRVKEERDARSVLENLCILLFSSMDTDEVANPVPASVVPEAPLAAEIPVSVEIEMDVQVNEVNEVSEKVAVLVDCFEQFADEKVEVLQHCRNQGMKKATLPKVKTDFALKLMHRKLNLNDLILAYWLVIAKLFGQAAQDAQDNFRAREKVLNNYTAFMHAVKREQSFHLVNAKLVEAAGFTPGNKGTFRFVFPVLKFIFATGQKSLKEIRRDPRLESSVFGAAGLMARTIVEIRIDFKHEEYVERMD